MPVTMSFDELTEARDVDLGHSDWFEVTQEQVDLFADATHDHQWIHVDPEQAAQGPFGGTIAHGYLTVSMLPYLVTGLIDVKGVAMGVNYGIDKLRMTSPVKVGSRIRANATLKDAQEKAGGILYRVDVTVEIEDAERPALVGTVLYLVYAG
jgi:acyl dehydratase